MLFAPEDQICGVPVAVAREAVRVVEAVQWCSAGVLARELRIDITASRLLLHALESDRRLTRYPGMLPSGHDGAWLPGEEASEEPLALWRLRHPEGKALAKARIGPAVPRRAAESLLAGFLDRVRAANGNDAGSHIVERVTLFGSLTDPGRQEVGDVDLLVYARRRTRPASPQEPHGEPGSSGTAKRGRWLSEDEATNLRMEFEALLRAGDERIDASVIDDPLTTRGHCRTVQSR